MRDGGMGDGRMHDGRSAGVDWMDAWMHGVCSAWVQVVVVVALFVGSESGAASEAPSRNDGVRRARFIHRVVDVPSFASGFLR